MGTSGRLPTGEPDSNDPVDADVFRTLIGNLPRIRLRFSLRRAQTMPIVRASSKGHWRTPASACNCFAPFSLTNPSPLPPYLEGLRSSSAFSGVANPRTPSLAECGWKS